MKTINVVAGIIKKDNKIFIAERGYGEFKGMYEFPGGKIEYTHLSKSNLWGRNGRNASKGRSRRFVLSRTL